MSNPKVRTSQSFRTAATLSCTLFFLLLLPFCHRELAAQSIEEYTRQASQLMRNYQWKQAVVLLEAGLQSYPEEPALLLGLGSALTRLGHPGQGEILLGKALILQPKNPEVLHGVAEAQLRQGDIATTIALFQESLQYGSNDKVLHRLAFSLFLQGEEKQALEHARQAVEANPLNASHRLL